jgi:hypothetical protein
MRYNRIAALESPIAVGRNLCPELYKNKNDQEKLLLYYYVRSLQKTNWRLGKLFYDPDDYTLSHSRQEPASSEPPTAGDTCDHRCSSNG